ncbi:hypothetical protein NRF20_21100 [Streptomyces sp. R-74717]
MRAELGGPQVPVAAELPEPVAGPGEVVIEVSHVDIGFVETRIRSGVFREYFPVRRSKGSWIRTAV